VDGNGGTHAAVLLEIARALAHAESEQAIASLLTGMIFDAVAASAGAAYMVTEDGAHVEIVAYRGPAGHDPPRQLPLDAELPLPVCVRTAEPVFLATRDEIVASFPALADMLRAPSTDRESVVCLPLFSGNVCVGGLVFGFDEPRELGAADRAFFLTIKNHVSVAVERARLRVAERAARRRLEIIANTSRMIGQAPLAVSELCSIVADQLATAIGGTCSLDLLSVDRAALEPAAAADVDAARLASVRATMLRDPVRIDEGSSLARVASSGAPMLISAVDMPALLAATHHASYRAHLERFPLRSLAILPLRAAGRVIGTLTLSTGLDGPALTADDVTMLADLADRSALAIANARLHERAIHAIAAREDLLAVVSHDLRNMLGTFSVGVEVLAETAADPKTTKVIGSMQRSLAHANELIRNLLELARLDGGALELERVAVPVRELIRDVVAVHERAASDTGLTLASEVAADAGGALATHAMLFQVLANLIGNALKFTPAGGTVTVSAQRAGNRIAFAVADTGAGIAAEDLPHIFDRYWQAQRTRKRGVGLGLAIVHGIVTALGGSIDVVSEVGRGTTFRVEIPAAP
jgi:signal transduction histidine kinase